MPRHKSSMPETNPETEITDPVDIPFDLSEEEALETPSAAELGDLNPNVILPEGGYGANVKDEAPHEGAKMPWKGLSDEKIQLLHVYQGRRTKEQKIMPGIYAVDDPALYNLADYLVEHGHAIRLEAI